MGLWALGWPELPPDIYLPEKSHAEQKNGMAPPDDDGFPADQDEEMTVGFDCCPHMVPYGSDCDECDEEDADMSIGLTPKRCR